MEWVLWCHGNPGHRSRLWTLDPEGQGCTSTSLPLLLDHRWQMAAPLTCPGPQVTSCRADWLQADCMEPRSVQVLVSGGAIGWQWCRDTWLEPWLTPGSHWA